MKGIETDDIVNEIFKSFLKKYQEGLETKMEGSDFVFESVSLNNGGSYIDSPDWVKNKKATINPQNKDNGCFKYAITVALNHEKIGKDPQKISKVKAFIDKYNWKDIEFPSHAKDWKTSEQNNKTIALNILFVPCNTKQIRPAYISKYNHEREDQVILLMITNNDEHSNGVKNWHYLTVKSFFRLLKGITSNHKGDLLFQLFSFIHNQKKFEKHEKICKYAKVMISLM